jgi:MFS family permease
MKPLSTPSSEKWMTLGMLWLVCMLNYADRQAISSLFPILEKDYGFSKAQLGLIGSAFMWVYAASAPFAGYAGDRLPRKGLILGGCFFWSLMTALTGWCGKLWQFVSARALIGIGESVYFPAAASMLSDYHGAQTRSTALSLHQSAVYIGTIAGGGIGALLAERFGWRWAFYGFGAAGIIVSVLLLLRMREPEREKAEDLETIETMITTRFGVTLRTLLLNPGVLMLMLAFACANAVGAIFLIWAPTFLHDKFHLGLVEAGFSAVAAIQLASAVGSPLSGLLADKLSKHFAGARMAVQGCGLFLGVLCVVAVAHAGTMGMLMVSMASFGLCKGIYDGGIFASVFEFVKPFHRGSIAGLMNLLGWGGGALGPLAVGLLSTYGFGSPVERMSGAIAWSAGAYLAGGILIFGSLRCYRINRVQS